MEDIESNVVLLLGGNLGNRQDYLNKAKRAIEIELGKIKFETDIIETKPVGLTAELDFLNQIIVIPQLYSPIMCLNKIKRIELELGRTYVEPNKGEKYCSRCIDIDLLYYSNIIYKSDMLSIPHPQVYTRLFVNELIAKLPFNVNS